MLKKTKNPPATISGGGVNDDSARVGFLDYEPPDARAHLWTTRTTRAGTELVLIEAQRHLSTLPPNQAALQGGSSRAMTWHFNRMDL